MLLAAALRDAVRFWEVGRLGYNAALACTVFAVAMATDGWIEIGRQWPLIVLLGVIANALYCAVYPVDLAMQLMAIAPPGRRALRLAVWCAGTALAALIAAAVLTALAASGVF